MLFIVESVVQNLEARMLARPEDRLAPNDGGPLLPYLDELVNMLTDDMPIRGGIIELQNAIGVENPDWDKFTLAEVATRFSFVRGELRAMNAAPPGSKRCEGPSRSTYIDVVRLRHRALDGDSEHRSH